MRLPGWMLDASLCAVVCAGIVTYSYATRVEAKPSSTRGEIIVAEMSARVKFDTEWRERARWLVGVSPHRHDREWLLRLDYLVQMTEAERTRRAQFDVQYPRALGQAASGMLPANEAALVNYIIDGTTEPGTSP